MKKIIIQLAFTILGINIINAQPCSISVGACQPGSSGYCTNPVSGANFSPFTGGQLAGQKIDLVLGSNASISGFQATIIGATITGVSGLPAGVTNTMNPSNGILSPNSSMCMYVSGIPTQAGTFTVNLTGLVNLNAMGQTTVVPISGVTWNLVVASNTLSVNELTLANSINLSPNPTCNEVSLVSYNNLGSVSVLNSLGQTVLTQDAFNSVATKINVNSLSSGIYFIRVSNNYGIVTKKFIKE